MSQESPFIKPEESGVREGTVAEKPQTQTPSRGVGRKRRGRGQSSLTPSVSPRSSDAKRKRTSISTAKKTPRGGCRGRGRGGGRTKAAKSAAGVARGDEDEVDIAELAAKTLDYADDSSEDNDDDDDTGSDYVPPDAGRMNQIEAEEDELEEEEEDEEIEEEEDDEEEDGANGSGKRRCRRSGPGNRRSRNSVDETLDDPFAGMSDYEEEDDEDDDEMQESRINLMNEVSALQGFRNPPDESMSLFGDIAAAAVAAAAANAGVDTAGDGGADIYDFDAQSIASDKRFRKMKQAAATRQRRSTSARKSRPPPGSMASQTGASWGSNIYSALATSLKTRTDLDAYTNFLKCPYLNSTFDAMLVDLCRPSNQHMGLFFGPSASLQSLMGRVNDPDRVVELLHSFMSKPYDTLSNRILWFAPIIHQQPVPLSNIPAYGRQLSELCDSLDPVMRIEPAYILEASLNVLVQTGAPFTNLEVSLNQYNAINGAGNLGRFMTDVSQIIVSNDFWDQLNDLVALPFDKIVSYAQRVTEGGEGFVNIEAIEPPCLNRVVAAVNAENQLLGIALTDTWELNKAPLSRNRRDLKFQNLLRGPLQLSQIDKASVVNEDLSIELDTYGVLEQIIDTVAVLHQKEGETACPSTVRADPKIGRVHLMDCFLLKLNSRKDSLILVCFENSVSPPLPSMRPPGSAPYKVYALVSEESFFFTRFGITSDSPALMDGMFTADPEALTERKAVAILPDVVFDNLRSIALREIVASSGTAIVNAVLANINTTVTPCEAPTLYRCSKFILVDSQRRVPLAIVFEVPIRLSWVTNSNECSVRTLETASLNADFISVSAEALSSAEQRFASGVTECRLVAINGLLYALQVDENRVLQRVVELVPAGYDNITGRPNNAALSPRAISGDARACSAFLRIFNEESITSSVFPAVYLPHYSQQTIVEQVAGFCDELVDHIYTSPVSFSLYDVVFRMAIKHTPKMLARQHQEAAVAAAAASAAANPEDPPPPPVPMPEHWGVCSVCSKELHSVSGLLEHELRHVGLTKFRCNEHRVCFMDRRGLILHMSEHGGSGFGGGDGGDDDQDVVGFNETTIGEEDIKFIPGLTNVFARSSLLSGRMEAPQCDSCRDFFPTADVMAQHMEICDGISFSTRSAVDTGDVGEGNRSVCGICGQAVHEIKRHFTEVHLVCVLCHLQLHTIEELSYHYKVHVETSNAETFQQLGEVTTCETCLNFYSSKHNYYFHQWAEHGVIFKRDPTTGILGPVQVREPRVRPVDEQETVTSKLKCKFCQFVCPCSGKQYVDHLKSAHSITSDVALVCRFCAEIFANLDDLSAHLQAKHAPLSDYGDAGPQTVYSCDICDSEHPFYAFHKGMLDHARDVHSTLTPNMYLCTRCKERFSDRKLHRQHFETHAEGELFPCGECGKEFRSRQALRHHEQMRHDVEWDAGPATCEHCGITYPKRSALKYHIARMHNVELIHECPVCQQRFRTETYLRRHMKETHSGPIECEICHKQCANLRCYSQHRQKHFRDKIFQCTECSVSFKSKTAMRRHVRVEHMQLGPEKFECQICGKIVTQIGMHMLTHKDARFKCEYCDKQFTKSVYYNEHVRIHRGELPFECHICGRRFNKKSNLNVHLRFHEKHRDDEGNYLQLKARGRVSVMFGDASLTAEERAAKNAAIKNRANKPTASASAGPDIPGAFNVGGPAGAASDACAAACGGHLSDVIGLQLLTGVSQRRKPAAAPALFPRSNYDGDQQPAVDTNGTAADKSPPLRH